MAIVSDLSAGLRLGDPVAGRAMAQLRHGDVGQEDALWETLCLAGVGLSVLVGISHATREFPSPQAAPVPARVVVPADPAKMRALQALADRLVGEANGELRELAERWAIQTGRPLAARRPDVEARPPARAK